MATKKTETSSDSYLRNAAKTLATNIRFTSVDRPITTIALTSAVPKEGKSTISMALSQALASAGKRVLLVDCDMRRPSLGNRLGVRGRNGIYSVLYGHVSLEEAVVETSMSGVYFLDSESHIPNPFDILSSKRFQSFVATMKAAFDYVVIDTPPLTAFVDGALVGSVVDGTVLVVRRNYAKRKQVLEAYEKLQQAGCNVLGTCLNFCDVERSEYYYEYYYYKNGNKRERRKRRHGDGPSLPARMPVAPAFFSNQDARLSAQDSEGALVGSAAGASLQQEAPASHVNAPAATGESAEKSAPLHFGGRNDNLG